MVLFEQSIDHVSASLMHDAPAISAEGSAFKTTEARSIWPATSLCLTLLAICGLGLAWSWALLMLVRLMIQPSLDELRTSLQQGPF